MEPYIDFNRKTRANPYWRVLYPSSYYTDNSPIRSVILVNKRLDTDHWKQIPVPNNDLTAIQFSGNAGNLTIFNIYNDCENSDNLKAIENLLTHRTREILPHPTDNMIWAGDFNRHHPMWDDEGDTHLFTRRATREAEELIRLLAEHGMEMTLPQGIPTLQSFRTKKWSRPDNVFCSAPLAASFEKCYTVMNKRTPCTDHMAIVIELDILAATKEEDPTYNFRMVDWDEFRKKLKVRLATIPLPQDITSIEQYTRAIEDLTRIIQETIKEVVPLVKRCPYSKRWWTKELTKMKKALNQLSRVSNIYRAVEDHPSHVEWRNAAKEYAKAVDATRQEHWKDFLEEATSQSIWTANKYVTGEPTDGSKSRVPTLKVKQRDGSIQEATTNEQKSAALSSAFFPPPPAESNIDPNFEYPPPVESFKKFTRDQIIQHVAKLKPYKAPGLDIIPNVVLKQTVGTLADYFSPIFNATFALNTYYGPWKDYITVVLRKPGKPDYSLPKAYRPIALLNTTCKLLTSIVAEDMIHIAEKHQLLPSTQFGGRPGRTTTDAIHLLVHKIKDAWRKGNVVSVLFLDIEGAFPNAVTDRLIHILKSKGIPPEYVELIRNMLQGRRTRLKFDDYLSDFFEIHNGIGQGDPLSMVLYLFYNSELIEIPRFPSEGSTSFVDDAALIATGKTFKVTHRILQRMMTRPGGAYEWSKTHNSNFEISKFACIDFARRREADPTKAKKTVPMKRPTFTLKSHPIAPVGSHTFLGVIVDQELRWKLQTTKAVTNGEKWTHAIRRLSTPSKGIPTRLMRQLYQSVAIPKMTYGASVWFNPLHPSPRSVRNLGSVAASKQVAKVQRIATLTITGALRDTATDVLDAHAFTLPAPLLLEKTCHRETVRLATLPKNHPLYAIVGECSKKYPKSHRTPIHELLHLFEIDPAAWTASPISVRVPYNVCGAPVQMRRI